MALSQREQRVLAELESQMVRSRRMVASERLGVWWDGRAVKFGMAMAGLFLLVLSVLAWWPLAGVGYLLTAGAVVSLVNSSVRARVWPMEGLDRRHSTASE